MVLAQHPIGKLYFACFHILFSKLKPPNAGGQEVENNHMNRALIQYIRDPPDLMAGVYFSSE